MKKIIALIISGIIMMNLISCEPEMDYLNPDADVVESYYNSQEHLTYAVNATYNVVHSLVLWGREVPYTLNGRSDEGVFTFKAAAGDPTVVAVSGYTVTADAGVGAVMFPTFYSLQYAANLALEKLQENQAVFDMSKPQDKALYDRLMGEAYFMRGFSRFYLVYFYGDEIPDRDYTATNSDFYAMPAEKGVIYQKMVDDFKRAEELLPVRSVMYADPNNVGRATKGAAQAFLAKCYLGRPVFDGSASAGSAEWDEAKKVLWKIIDSHEYELVDNYRDNASEDNENNKESIFEVQYCKSLDINTGLPGNLPWGAEQTWRQICMTVPDPVCWWNLMPSLALYNEFERDASGNIIDARAFQGLWIPNGAKFRKGGNWIDYNQLITLDNGDERAVWRGKYLGTRKYGTDYDGYDMAHGGTNDRVIRYSDVLLMYAECCIETNDEPTALQYINMVRTRANKQMTSPTEADAHMFYAQAQGTLPTAEALMAAKPVLGQVKDAGGNVIIPGYEINTVRRLLKHEYSVELFMEGWRFFNLMRWYNNPNDPDKSTILNSLVDKYKVQIEQTGLTGAIPFNYDKHLRLPIPASELQTNPNMNGNSAN